MPFTLSKNGNNVSAEIQRWQYFLIRRGITQVGRLDGHFGDLTEKATKIFQLDQQLPVTGKVNSQTLEVAASFGYTILPDNYYAERNSPNWPPRPDDLSSPSSSWRNTKFTCFKFIQKANAFRDRPERIVI
ncbi:peptidoglycan-binding protein, partial [Rhizobiaceae sp. 2RAB30]